MKYLQIIFLCLSFIAIIAVATIINTEVAWARPAACDCVCTDCLLPDDQLEMFNCQAGSWYAYPCGRNDPTWNCREWCDVRW